MIKSNKKYLVRQGFTVIVETDDINLARECLKYSNNASIQYTNKGIKEYEMLARKQTAANAS